MCSAAGKRTGQSGGTYEHVKYFGMALVYNTRISKCIIRSNYEENERSDDAKMKNRSRSRNELRFP